MTPIPHFAQVTNSDELGSWRDRPDSFLLRTNRSRHVKAVDFSDA